MTVSSETYRNAYSGNDVTVEFAVNFYFLADAHLKVVLSVDATGVETVQTLTTHYTVTDAGEPAGGTVTMLTAPATGETLTIVRDVPLKQSTDYVDGTTFPAADHETAVDKLTMIVQQLQELIDRCIKLPVSQTQDPELELPVADRAIGWNSLGTALTNLADVGDLSVSAFIETLLDDTSAAAARATLAAAGSGDSKIEVIRGYDQGIVDNDTIDIVFTFVPDYILLIATGGVLHDTSLEKGVFINIILIEVTGTDTISIGELHYIGSRDFNGTPEYSNGKSTTYSIWFVGGYDGADQGQVSCLASGATTWATASKTLTLTLQEANTETANTYITFDALAWKLF